MKTMVIMTITDNDNDDMIMTTKIICSEYGVNKIASLRIAKAMDQ